MAKGRPSSTWMDHHTYTRNLGSGYRSWVISISLGCFKRSISPKFTRTRIYTTITTHISQNGTKSILGKTLEEISSIYDSLVAIGNPIPVKAKFYSLLTNLGPKYESFATIMLKPHIPLYTKVVSHLESFEQWNSWIEASNSPHMHSMDNAIKISKQQNYNNRSHQNNQFTSKGRGFQATNNSFQYSNFASNSSEP